MRVFHLAALLSAIALAPVSAVAQDIVLSAKTGSQQIKGKLLGFDGEFFQVETQFGPVNVDARTVECEGVTCPEVSFETEAFNAFGDPSIVLPLIESFALFQGGEVTLSGPDPQIVTVATSGGEVLAKVTLGENTADALRDGSNSILFSTLKAPDPSLAQTIGTDAIVIATSSINSVSTITLDQMRQILNGTITNWRDLGGGDSDIIIHYAQGDEGFRAQIEALNLGPAAGMTVSQHSRLQDAADAVANDPFGVAVLPFSQLRIASPMGLRGSCGLHNKPGNFTIQSGAYPLGYDLSVSKPNKKLPLFAREFLEFLNSEQAQSVIADLGFADKGISRRGLDTQGQRLANTMMIIGQEVALKDVREMTAIMSGAEILSSSFRFEGDTDRLDAPSKEAAKALVSELSLGNFADKAIYILGFSDGEGRARQNKTRSKELAQAVLAEVKGLMSEGAVDDLLIEISGYGEASPLVCEDTENDKNINRRVEIWIKDPVINAPESAN